MIELQDLLAKADGAMEYGAADKGALVIRFKTWNVRKANYPFGPIDFIQADGNQKQRYHTADGPTI